MLSHRTVWSCFCLLGLYWGAITFSQTASADSIASATPPCTPAQAEKSGLRTCAELYTAVGPHIPPALFPTAHAYLQGAVEHFYKPDPATGNLPVGPTFCDAAPTTFFKPETDRSHDGITCGPTQQLHVHKSLTGGSVEVDRTGMKGVRESGWVHGSIVSAIDHVFKGLEDQLTTGNSIKIHQESSGGQPCGAAAIAYQALLSNYVSKVQQLARSRPTVDVHAAILGINPADPDFKRKTGEAISPAYLTLASARSNVEQAFASLVSCEASTLGLYDWEQKAGNPDQVKAMITDMGTRIQDCCSDPDSLSSCYQDNIALIARAQTDACWTPVVPDAVNDCADPKQHLQFHPCPMGGN